MMQENGRYLGGDTPETEPIAMILSKRDALAIDYEALIDEILEEVEDDSYWTTSQRLEDGEIGLPPINTLSALQRIANRLHANKG